MNNWKKILNELSYRVSSGIPDLTNEQHLIKLWDILKEEKWPINARVELLKNLDEKISKVYVKGKGPGGVKLQVGPRGGKYYMGNPKTGEPAPEAKKDFDKSQMDDFKNAVDDKDNILLKEKNKEVNQDIDFEENPPESITAEIDPTDEEFEGKKERGVIKEQTFDPDEIEVGGEKIKLPKGNIFSKYIFSSENQYLLYPKNFNYHSKNYKDTFQHGGISMEEIIIPFVELIPKYK